MKKEAMLPRFTLSTEAGRATRWDRASITDVAIRLINCKHHARRCCLLASSHFKRQQLGINHG